MAILASSKPREEGDTMRKWAEVSAVKENVASAVREEELMKVFIMKCIEMKVNGYKYDRK